MRVRQTSIDSRAAVPSSTSLKHLALALLCFPITRSAKATQVTDNSLLQDAQGLSAGRLRNGDRLWFPVLSAAITPPLIYALLVPTLDGALVGLAGQLLLSLSVLISLWLLKPYPLINPVHAVVLFFQWWFGWAPAVCAAYWIWEGDPRSACEYTLNGIAPILIVSLGLPLFAGVSRFILSNWRCPQLADAAPKQASYSFSLIVRLCVVAAVAWAILQLFGLRGIRAFETVNYLGGQQTLTWWLMPFVECEQLLDLAAVASCTYLVTSGKQASRKQRIAALVIIGIATARALTSGSKGAIVKPAFYVIVAFVNWRRRIPWSALACLLFSYLIFVEPYVDGMRMVSERLHVTTPEQRTELFRRGFFTLLNDKRRAIHPDIESVFRGIYPYTQQVMRQSRAMSGPWKGKTIRDDISSLVPRVLLPTKADTNTGNFFAHQLSDISDDNPINIAITMPFEVVGNFGWCAGILSFVVIGLVWTPFVAWALTIDRLTTHPLTPFMIGVAMIMEQSIGQAMNALKILVLILILLWFIVRTPRVRITL